MKKILFLLCLLIFCALINISYAAESSGTIEVVTMAEAMMLAQLAIAIGALGFIFAMVAFAVAAQKKPEEDTTQ